MTRTETDPLTDANAFTLTGFADEIDPSLATQLDVLEEEGISHFDLRGVGNTNVLDLTDDQLAEIRAEIDRRGIGVSSIGSPIGKIDVTDDFEPHFERFERAIEIAEFFDVEYVRIFSYYVPEDDDPADHREEVLRRIRRKTERAAEADVTLVHENEKDIYGDTPARCRDLLTAVDSPHLRAAFDPANFLEIGVEPIPDALVQLVEYVEYLHVKDAELGERGAIRPAGRGDARFEDLIRLLDARGYDGFASLEPHLEHAGPQSGRSGPDGFEKASRAFKSLLVDTGANHD